MMLTNGILSINEIRGELGLPRINSEEGDTHWIQLSFGSAKDISQGKYIKQQAKDQSEEYIDGKAKKKGD